MTDLQLLAYSALDRWEREGEYPDEDEFLAIMKEWKQLLETGQRFQRVVEACEEAEHLRRVRTNGHGVTDDEVSSATDFE